GEIDGWLAQNKRVVLACSALKASYRDRLSPDKGGVSFVYLQANRDLIDQRLAGRQGHYMPASLLDSQLQALEPPDDAIAIDTERPLDDILDDLVSLVRSKA
ncbi:MAG: gluconokinase, partial [Geminicoccaceae bacterium]